MAQLSNDKKIVNIINGTGNEPIPCPYSDGDTVKTILQKKDIHLEAGMTVTLGRKRIRHMDKTKVKPGDTLVVARKICNG